MFLLFVESTFVLDDDECGTFSQLHVDSQNTRDRERMRSRQSS